MIHDTWKKQEDEKMIMAPRFQEIDGEEEVMQLGKVELRSKEKHRR
jgi:hypothetical protein